jgi:hypothetical protein
MLHFQSSSILIGFTFPGISAWTGNFDLLRECHLMQGFSDLAAFLWQLFRVSRSDLLRQLLSILRLTAAVVDICFLMEKEHHMICK